MALHVLNPGGKDRFQDFRERLPGPGEGHAPVNFHAWAAASGGVFAQNLAEIPDDGSPVVVLLRRRLGASAAAIRELRGRGRVVWVSWKETGRHQVDAQLRHWGNPARLRKILATSHGVVSPVRWIEAHYREFAGPELRFEFLPTPYPLDAAGWDFLPTAEPRRGILIGTREFGVPSRRHAEALETALQLHLASGEPVTVVNGEGSRGLRPLRRLEGAWMAAAGGKSPGPSAENSPALTVLDGPLAYPDWLTLMARHRLVWQQDDSGVPGQVAGDSLLAGTPCLGGQGEIDRILLEGWRARLPLEFADAEPEALAKALLRANAESSATWCHEWQRAGADLSFAAFRQRLADRPLTAAVLARQGGQVTSKTFSGDA